MGLVKVPTRLLGAGSEIQSVYSEATSSSVLLTLVTGTYPNLAGGNLVCYAVITPTSASSILDIVATVNVQINGSAVNTGYVFVLKDGVTPVINNCKLTDGDGAVIGTSTDQVTLRRRIVAGSTSPITFEIKAGTDNALCNFYVNKDGGVSTLLVTEYQA